MKTTVGGPGSVLAKKRLAGMPSSQGQCGAHDNAAGRLPRTHGRAGPSATQNGRPAAAAAAAARGRLTPNVVPPSFSSALQRRQSARGRERARNRKARASAPGSSPNPFHFRKNCYSPLPTRKPPSLTLAVLVVQKQ